MPQQRRVEQARESLIARIGEIGRRVHDARAKLDLRAQIMAHPRAAVVIAFALGAAAGTRRTSAGDTQRGLANTAVAMLGSLAISIARDIAMQRATDWWSQAEREA